MLARSSNPILWKSVAVRHQAGIDAFENLPQVPDSVRSWALINRRWGCSAFQGIKPTVSIMAFTSHQKEVSCPLIGIVALRKLFILGTLYFVLVHIMSYILTWVLVPKLAVSLTCLNLMKGFYFLNFVGCIICSSSLFLMYKYAK